MGRHDPFFRRLVLRPDWGLGPFCRAVDSGEAAPGHGAPGATWSSAAHHGSAHIRIASMKLRPHRSGNALHPRLPRRTIRVRLALQFFAVFLAAGTVLLIVTFSIWQSRTNALRATPGPGGGEQITPVSSDAHQLLIASGITLALMAGASILIGWLVAGRFLKPMRTITATARVISATNLHERLNLSGPDDELKELADTLTSYSTDLSVPSPSNASSSLTPLTNYALRSPECGPRLK